MTFEDIQKEALAFRDRRDWKQFHNPKDLAISISLEAAELLECFQWTGGDLQPHDADALKDELADVMIYSIYLADAMGLDLTQILQDKIRKNASHYPEDKARGTAKKYTEL